MTVEKIPDYVLILNRKLMARQNCNIKEKSSVNEHHIMNHNVLLL